MKNFIFCLLVIAALVACGKSKKQRLEGDTLYASISTNESASLKDTSSQKQKEDTTIYKEPYYTAEIKDASEYFRTNNRFKDWDKNNKKFVFLAGIVEKDGSLSRLRIGKSSGDEELDEEAIRLIKNATIFPAKNESMDAVRSYVSMLVHFPPK